ncbi:MAG TPA: LysR substrate-binding domain-containing protein [Polyangiaceae bacterium]|nr:LysR substrate-binding domain-containing protein [Polyangiaceae bacterium]
MELRDLSYFLACVDNGSITAAARRVHAAQPTISHALSRLEVELGVRLLERGARAPLRVTEAGQRLAERARQALASLGAVQDDLAEVKNGVRGQLRLCAVQSACVSLLPRALAAFVSAYPAVELSVRTLAAEKIARAVAGGQADLGFVAGAPSFALRDVDRELLRREELLLLVRKSDPLARRKAVRIATLAARPLVLVPGATFTGEIIHEACRAAGFEPQVVLTLSSAEALCEVVRAGLASTILPAGYLRGADSRADGLVAIRLKDPTPRRDLWLIRRRPASLPTPRAADEFLRLLRANADFARSII